MANFNLYFPKEILAEGSVFEDVPGDNGHGTKWGLTLDDIHEYNIDLNHDGKIDINDVMDLTRDQAAVILKKLYWDYFLADGILNQSLAEFIVDGGLNMGRPLISKYVQYIVHTTVDGHVGAVTLKAINFFSPSMTFSALYDMRKKRYGAIVAANPSQLKFAKGWFNRLNAITFVK